MTWYICAITSTAQQKREMLGSSIYTPALLLGPFIGGTAFASQVEKTAPVCYSQARTSNCVDAATITKCGGSWCDATYNLSDATWHNCSAEVGKLAKIGQFPSKEICLLIIDEVVKKCKGAHGGTWTDHGYSLNVNFCSWS